MVRSGKRISNALTIEIEHRCSLQRKIDFAGHHSLELDAGDASPARDGRAARILLDFHHETTLRCVLNVAEPGLSAGLRHQVPGTHGDHPKTGRIEPHGEPYLGYVVLGLRTDNSNEPVSNAHLIRSNDA